MSKTPFNKFIVREETGAKKKERIRQEKKQVRKETKAYFEEKKRTARQGFIEREKLAPGKRKFAPDNTRNTARPASDTANRSRSGQFATNSEGARKPAARTGNKTGSHTSNRSRSNDHSTNNEDTRKPAVRTGNKTGSDTSNRSRPGQFSSNNEDTRKPAARTGNKTGSHTSDRSGSGHFASGDQGARKPAAKSNLTPAASASKSKKPLKTADNQQTTGPAQKQGAASDAMPLNKFIAHAGICSRRDAAELVKSGKVVVNGQAITEPGFKVSGNEEIKVNGKKIALRRNLVYILLNKPKDYITTTEDPQGRKTVLDIIKRATPERVYPIGRLDRNTTGVLLFTNDGELAQKLAHPSYEVKKIYEVTLDKPLAKKDFDTLMGGVTLEDGPIAPDALAYADAKDKAVIGIEIHSGRNRIVRRIFEHLGYDVRNLDRVMYANLTKKNVERGKWRFLTEKEVRLLKYLNTSYTRK